MELIKGDKKVTLSHEMQIKAYKKAGWTEIKGKADKKTQGDDPEGSGNKKGTKAQPAAPDPDKAAKNSAEK